MNEEKRIGMYKCKFCGAGLEYSFADVVFYQDRVKMEIGEPFILIATYVCSHCLLVQSVENVKPEESESFYLSSFSSSRLIELQKYTNHIFKKIENENSKLVAEFVDQGLNRSSIFGNRNLHTLIDVYGKADLLICHDAFSYSLDINDFVSALKLFLKPEGSVIFEFLHLLPWMEEESGVVIGNTSFTYYSFVTIEKILLNHGLVCYDVMECSPPGSLRVYAKHRENLIMDISNSVQLLREIELVKGMNELNTYLQFQDKVNDRVLQSQHADQHQLQSYRIYENSGNP